MSVMAKKTTHWLNNHFNLNACSMEVVLGLLAFCYGLWLFHVKHFFYYPPTWVWIMDDPYIDLFLSLIGVLLFVFALIHTKDLKFEQTRTAIIRILLIVLEVLTLCIGLLKLEHSFFMSDNGMLGSAIQDLSIAAFTFLTASAA